MDIHNSIMDIHNSIMDIHNYGVYALLAFHNPQAPKIGMDTKTQIES